ncbi:hypothetical protein Cal7507_4887 [Calothrix sp. PCC 7507]|nr:hypothetical protein Cal7507_4887 [Calothrix sp. PCC 7507]
MCAQTGNAILTYVTNFSKNSVIQAQNSQNRALMARIQYLQTREIW